MTILKNFLFQSFYQVWETVLNKDLRIRHLYVDLYLYKDIRFYRKQ